MLHLGFTGKRAHLFKTELGLVVVNFSAVVVIFGFCFEM